MPDHTGSPPAQQQTPPGRTDRMRPEPHDEMRAYTGRALLDGKRTLVAGGDSGIGRAVSVAFAKEGADVAITYYDDVEDDDAQHTAELVRQQNRRCTLYKGDLADESFCTSLPDRVVEELGGLEVLVNHAGVQAYREKFTEIDSAQFNRTFTVNVYGPFWLTRAALPHIPSGGAVINTGSVNGLRGNKALMDYSASKAAVHILTKSLAQSLADSGIRVNCVAPGPVWTPLIPSTLPDNKVEGFGEQTPMNRMAQPDEIAPSYVFFAAGQLSGYYTGEVLAPTGGETHPG